MKLKKLQKIMEQAVALAEHLLNDQRKVGEKLIQVRSPTLKLNYCYETGEPEWILCVTVDTPLSFDKKNDTEISLSVLVSVLYPKMISMCYIKCPEVKYESAGA